MITIQIDGKKGNFFIGEEEMELMTDEECDYIRALAKKLKKRGQDAYTPGEEEILHRCNI